MGSPVTCVCSAPLSQARHSKQQLVLDLNSGVYLRTSKIHALVLLVCLTLTRSSQCYAYLVSTSLPCRAITAGLGKLGGKSSQSLLCHWSWLPVLGITQQGLWVPLAFISIHLPDLQDPHPCPGSFLQPGSSSPFWGRFFFPGASTVCVLQDHTAPSWWSCLLSLYE